MSGWLAFLAVAGVVLALVWRLGRLERGPLMLVSAALFVAAAGYSWQGRPDLPGAPAADRAMQGLRPDTLFAIERVRLLSPYGEAGQWLTFADGLNRSGEDQAAASALRGAIAKFPRDVALRLGYAHALLAVADYHETPAVRLAFARAAAIDPTDPAPAYFAGLAALEAGDMATAEQRWRDQIAALPAASPWRRVIGERLALFDRIRAGAPGMVAPGG